MNFIDLRLHRFLFHQCRGGTFGILVLLFLQNCIWFANTFFNIAMTNAAIEKRFRDFLLLLIGVALLMLGLTGLKYLESLLQSRLRQHLANTVRMHLVRGEITLDAAQLEHQDVGVEISRLTQDVGYLCENGINQFFQFVSGVLAIAMALLAAAVIHWSYIVVFPLTMAMSLLAPKLFGPKFQKQATFLSACRQTYVSGVRDIFAAANVFKRSNQQSHFVNEMTVLSETFEDSAYLYNRKVAQYSNAIQIFSIFSQLLYVLATLILIFLGLVSIGSIVGVLNISMSVFSNVTLVFSSVSTLAAVSPIFDQLHITPAAFERAKPRERGEGDALIQEPSMGCSHSPDEQPSVSGVEIALDNVSLGYGSHVVLRHLNYRFESGKKYALVGPSGCGKTTLLRALLKELPPLEGELYLRSQPYSALVPENLYARIGFVQQDPYLLNRSLRENITLGAEFSEEKIQLAVQRASLTEFVQGLPDGLETIVTGNGKNISGGQKQRIVLAREYVRGKSILLMDEGTAALDQKTKSEIEQQLLEDERLLLIYICHPRSEEELKGFDEVIRLG